MKKKSEETIQVKVIVESNPDSGELIKKWTDHKCLKSFRTTKLDENEEKFLIH